MPDASIRPHGKINGTVDWIVTFAFFIVITITGESCALHAQHPENLFSMQYDRSLSRDRIVLIIPGMHQSNRDSGYDSVGAYYASKAITPVYINIDWKAVNIGKLAVAALHINSMLRDSFPDAHIYLFGFSFGAVISLKLSQSIHAEHILLCSMSPLFAEDRMHQIFPFKQILGLVTNYSTNGLSYSCCLGTCVFFLYGDHDSFVINNAIIQNRKASFTCNETSVVANARHTISGPAYLKAIKRIVDGISK